ncbi:MAG: transglycosylase SLT domain-containing protein, partial [Bdellovibrionota bacterium]
MRGAYAAVKTLAFTALAFALSQSLFADEMLIMGPPQATSAQFDAARTVQFPASYGPFKFDSKIEKRVGFWVNVYVKYHSWETVIHDVKYPWLVYSSIDTTGKPKNAVNIEKARVSALLKRVALKQKQLAAKTLSREKLRADEEKILQLFEANDLVGEIADAAQIKRVRGQAGLRDAMEDALFVSGRYLPRMEKVFERFNLPTEIAYLPFVESGFNKRAMSKVGASGIWQFMPYTGKLYLRVDAEVDERNDPMRAAEAAARLMQNNFTVLG